MITLDYLRSVGGPIAAEYLPGWDVRWILCTQEQIDTLVPGALAVCRAKDATPTRSIAICYVIADWPASESLPETLWHELTHAVVSPLVALIPESAASVMLEEQIVERIGKILSRVPRAARLAVIRGINECAPRLRARISALAPRARTGEKMDPNQVKEALDAIEGGDAAKCAEILKALIASAASGGAAPTTEPDGDEPTMDQPLTPPAKLPAEGAAPMKEDPAAARLRARAKSDADEIATMRNDLLGERKASLIDGLRARLPGHSGLPAIEAKIKAAPTYAGAKDIAEIAESMGGGVTRARSNVEHNNATGTGGDAPEWTAESLKAEGFGAAFIAELTAEHKANPKMAAATLKGGRGRLASGANPWAAQPGKAVS